MSRPLRPSLWLIVLALATTLVQAGERTHRVRGGESASTIALQHYGKHELGRLLLRYNEKPSTVIRVGETLRVPYCEVHRIERGDSWSELAQRYLGSARLYAAIATLNGLDPARPLQVGIEVVIPVVLSHRLERGQTLNDLALEFYGEESMRDMLRAFNAIDDPRRMSVGQRIAVPLVILRLRDDLHAKLPAPSPREPARSQADPPAVAAVKEQRTDEPGVEGADRDDAAETPVAEAAPAGPPALEPAPPRFGEELGKASEAFADGDYAAARELLESLIEPVVEQGNAAEQADLGRLLAFTYVAFDLPDEACAVYRSIGGSRLEQAPLGERVSPKIRQTLSGCE